MDGPNSNSHEVLQSRRDDFRRTTGRALLPYHFHLGGLLFVRNS
jgi:hypothetical protein